MARALRDGSASPGSGERLVPAEKAQQALQAYEEPVKPPKKAVAEAAAGDAKVGDGGHAHEREMARRENLSMCCKMVIFFLYLIIFTASMLHEQSMSSARLADHVKATLSGGAVPLSEVSSTALLYDYLERSFVPAVFGESIDRAAALRMGGPLVPMDFSNRLLGTVRLRQSRVDLKAGCQLTPMFQSYNIRCYPAFEQAAEATRSFGSYAYSMDARGIGFAGRYGTYGPHGYMHLLPTNASQALADVASLRAGGFLDEATRALFLEFNVWSSNVATYAAVTVAFEFGPTGSVRQEVKVMTLNQGTLDPGGLGTLSEWLAFVGVIVVVVFNLYFMCEEGQEIWSSHLGYFLDAWNVLDWINMIVLIVAFILRVVNFQEAMEVNIGSEQALGGFTNLRGIAHRAYIVSLLHAVNGVLLWGKAIKYFRYLPLLKEIIHVVWNAFDLFLPFIFMFAVAFAGFAMAYNIGFGDKIWELSTFYSSAVYLGRAFLRDIRLMIVYDLSTPLFAAFLILLYYVTLVLVGASFLFAIIADALFRARFEATKPNPFHRDEPCEECLRELARLCCRRRRFAARAQVAAAPAGASGGKEQQLALPAATLGKGLGSLAAAKLGGRTNKALAFGSTTAQLLDAASETASSGFEAAGPRLPERGELMRAVELMSGRILSEIAIVSIEIKSELHEVCERVAQMQMAVEELTSRAERVQQEQQADIH